MRFTKKVTSSLVIAVIALLASIIIPIVPCRTAPAVPNPIYKWNLCSLNPDTFQHTTWIKEYLGYTTSLYDAYFLVLIISFLSSLLILHLITPKTKQ